MAQAKQLKIKKKRWVQIVGPALIKHMPLGETFVGEPEEAVGRTINVSLMALTGDPKRQSTHVSFFIDGVKEGVLTTSVRGMELLPSTVKRLVRRGKERVDDSFDAVTKDGMKLRIKPLVITRGSTARSICSRIKHKARDLVVRAMARSTLDQFWEDLVNSKVQKEMGHALSKIYPVQACDIRSFKIIGTGTPPELPAEEQPLPSEPEDGRAEDAAEKPKRKVRSRKSKEETSSLSESPVEQASQAPMETPAEVGE